MSRNIPDISGKRSGNRSHPPFSGNIPNISGTIFPKYSKYLGKCCRRNIRNISEKWSGVRLSKYPGYFGKMVRALNEAVVSSRSGHISACPEQFWLKSWPIFRCELRPIVATSGVLPQDGFWSVAFSLTLATTACVDLLRPTARGSVLTLLRRPPFTDSLASPYRDQPSPQCVSRPVFGERQHAFRMRRVYIF